MTNKILEEYIENYNKDTEIVKKIILKFKSKYNPVSYCESLNYYSEMYYRMLEITCPLVQQRNFIRYNDI